MSFLLDYNPGTQQWGYPRRGVKGYLTGTCIVHTAECAADNIGDDTSAEGCANMIARRADYGSYHRLVDSDSIIDMVPWEYEAWQDSETNNWAVGISAALRTTDWATMPDDRRESVYRNLARCGADFVLYMQQEHGIEVPRERINGAQARAGKPGFCAHGDSGIARSDPGRDFDWDLFFQYINEALNGVPLAATAEEETEMLILIKGADDAIWIGNFVTRRQVPDLQTLADIQYRHDIGEIRIINGGKVIEGNVELAGKAV